MPKRRDPEEQLARQRDWIMVRLRRTTHQVLTALGRSWQNARDQSRNAPEPESDGGFSIDQIVRELYRRDLMHRHRSRASRTRRKRAPDPAASQDGPTPDPQHPDAS